jgi:hypothetical protein
MFISSILTYSNAQNFALHFDGNDDEVRMNTENSHIIGDAFTIEAWINATEWRDQYWQGTIVGKDKTGLDEGYAFRCGKNGTLSFVMSVNNIWNEVVTGPVMEESVWNHVAIVIEDGTMTLFINGEASANSSYNGSFSNSPILGTKIGASGEFPGRIFHGAIDEVRIWNIARTGNELFTFSTEQLEGDEAGLVAYLPLDEGTGTTTANLANNNNPGKLANMDESAWVGGAALSGKDLGVTAILNPNLLDLFKRPVEVVAEIKNFGNEDLSQFDIELYLNNQLIAEETVIADLASGAKTTYTFSQYLDATDLSSAEIEVRTSSQEDTNTLNDGETLAYVKPDGNSIRLFDTRTHNFGSDGQTQLTQIILPSDLQTYEQILLSIQLTCPSGGCDPWDQPANISVINDGNEYEIARYITPYGIACDSWTVDITDFKSILGGINDFKSYIQVWGGSGWNLTADINLIESENTNTFHKLSTLWQTDYQVYGDPSISHDLNEQTIIVDADTEASHMRMTITGHGQANTDNAAEFSPKTHQVLIDNVAIADHYLWKNDCEFNSCSNQAGTWEFDRAGWCPGQAVTPYTLDLSDQLEAGFLTRLDYRLQDYVNLLNTGYNGGSHTEPHYRIHAFLIEESSKRYEFYRNLFAKNLDIDLDPDGNPAGPIELTIENNGTVLSVNPTVRYYVDEQLIAEETYNGTINPGDVVVHTFSSTDGIIASAENVVAQIDYNNDQNIGDDFIKMDLSGIINSTSENTLTGIEIFPNPNEGMFTIENKDGKKLVKVEVYNLTGKLVQTGSLVEKKQELFLENGGMYIVKIIDDKQAVFSQKIIVID